MTAGMNVGSVGEFELIRRIHAILGPHSERVVLGLGDDAAIVSPDSRPLIITTDAMVEGVHFRNEWTSAADLAYKSIASNVSDLACKCAEPAYAVIALGLRGDIPVSWVEEYYRTAATLREEWGIEIIGGDTISSSQIFVSITAFGYQITDKPVTIRNARVGDWILVTGSLGGAAAGLEIVERKTIRNENERWLTNRFLRPQPRIQEAAAIVNQCVPTAMTDISDGLARDLPKLCAASGVGARIDPDALPCSGALKAYASERTSEYAWKGGEDYELLFTLPPSEAANLLHHWEGETVPVTKIGEIAEAGEGIILEGWTREAPGGFDHFQAR